MPGLLAMSGLYHPPPDASSPYRDRLLHPQWDTIETALGRPVPGVLRELHQAPEMLLRGHFYLARPDGTARAWVDLFLPMDEEALRPYGLTLPPGAVAFADDEHGDPYYFLPDPSEYGDGPVFVLDHRNGRSAAEPLSPSLAEFLRWTRQYQHQLELSMMSLAALGAWEDRLLRQLGRCRGSLEDRDGELTRTGLYADYAALFGGYVDLAQAASSPDDRLEALKRAVFLAWYEGAEPAPLSGLAELPELAVRRTLELLEERCRRGELDDELAWMLPWYHVIAEHSLLRLPGLRCLEARVGTLDPTAWESACRPDSLLGRGAMGRYWSSLRRAA